MRTPSVSINQALSTRVNIIGKAEKLIAGDTVLKRRQRGKINGVWNSTTPTKISLRQLHSQFSNMKYLSNMFFSSSIESIPKLEDEKNI